MSFYYRYSAPSGERVRIPLGVFDPNGRDGLTLVEARRRAGTLSVRYQDGDRDLRALLTEEESARARELEAKRQREEADAARKAGTLGSLLSLYCDSLESNGKASARAVRAAIRRHVQDAHPVIWAKPALDVVAEDGIAILGPLARAGKAREAAKLRSYLRAAFSAAVRSHTDPKAVPELRKLGVRGNPFAELATIEGASGARERALSVAELRAYWKHVQGRGGQDVNAALLRFHLLTGCQRIEQLARAVMEDLDNDLNALVLRDIKGRRREPRPHVVPLIPTAVQALREMQGGEFGDHLFTVDGGESGAVYSVVRHRLQDIVAAMRKAKELEGSAFTLGDLRRTVETRLAALHVSKEVRGQLQSHGLGGVQARHYDRHDYLAEKRAALETLHGLLIGKPAKVVELRPKNKKKIG